MKRTLTTLTTTLAVAFATLPMQAQAGIHYDKHGNVGYDTLQECQDAVHAGNAKFYQPFTHKPPLLRKGETKVTQGFLEQLGEVYQYGACDLGAAHKDGRDGVAKELQGKYVPYSPKMPVNIYTDRHGQIMRVSMQQCDNWFHDMLPNPIAKPVANTPAVEVETTAIPSKPTVVQHQAQTIKPMNQPATTATTNHATKAAVPAVVATTAAIPAATAIPAAVIAAQGAIAAIVPLTTVGVVALGSAALISSESSSTTGTH